MTGTLQAASPPQAEPTASGSGASKPDSLPVRPYWFLEPPAGFDYGEALRVMMAE